MSSGAQSQEPQQPSSQSTATVIRLRGLPWSTTAEEILDFLKDIRVKNGLEGVHIKMQMDGRSSGEAFVELETIDDRDASLALNGQYIGKRFVEVYDSSYPIMEREIGQVGAGGKGCVIRLRGLPYGSTDEDVRSFLQGVGVESVTIQISDNSKQTGEAFVILSNPDDAEKALERHKERIGSRYIEVFRSCYEDIIPVVYPQAYGRRGGGPYDRGGPRNYPGGGPMDRGYASRKGSGYERLYHGQNQPNFNQGYGMQYGSGSGYASPTPAGNYGYGMPTPGQGVPNQMVSQQTQGGGPGPQSQGGSGGGGGGGNTVQQNQGGPIQGPGGVAGSQQMGYSPQGASVNQYPATGSYGNGQGYTQLPAQGYPGVGYYGQGQGQGQGQGSEMVTYPPIQTTAGGYQSGTLHQVKLRGLPFSAGEYEVKQFLSPCEPSSVEIIFDNYKRPSGEAVVTFGTFQEVEEALKKDKQYMGKRYIDVFPLNKGPKGGSGGQGGGYRGGGGYGGY